VKIARRPVPCGAAPSPERRAPAETRFAALPGQQDIPMSKLQLSYFDFRNGRGEAARLALVLGGMAFTDDRIALADWPTRREQMFFHAVPVLERDGDSLSQSCAITRYVGRLTGLYPEDAWEAARCDEIMETVEELTAKLVATFAFKDDEAAFREARRKLGEEVFPFFLERLHTRLIEAGGEYFADDRATVADLSMAVWIRNLTSGNLDHIPADVVDRVAPLLIEHRDRVFAIDAIQAFYR
jgi:glutathione S-transferase